jgi:hypothetical protein
LFYVPAGGPAQAFDDALVVSKWRFLRSSREIMVTIKSRVADRQQKFSKVFGTQKALGMSDSSNLNFLKHDEIHSF